MLWRDELSLSFNNEQLMRFKEIQQLYLIPILNYLSLMDLAGSGKKYTIISLLTVILEINQGKRRPKLLRLKKKKRKKCG